MFSEIDWNRLLSFIIALLYLVIAYFIGGGEFAMKIILFLILPMAAIWFSDALGDITSSGPSIISFAPINRQSPGIIVKIAGWILLLSPVAAAIISKFLS